MSALYIGIMTGNSMDAIDVAAARWEDGKLTLEAHAGTPFSHEMIARVEDMRHRVMRGLSMAELNELPAFLELHDAYTRQVADAVVAFIKKEGLPLDEIKAVCTHGKTLDHRPPSYPKRGKEPPYTLQIGSGQMLADMIAKALGAPVRVLYDFRSDDIMNGGEGAPLAPPLAALLARQEGILNKIDYNAGNTSNLTLINGGEAVQSWDAGPCNEFIDGLVRRHTHDIFDVDGKYALQGKLNKRLLQHLYDLGRPYYETLPPKSGDPAYYHFEAVKAFQTGAHFHDTVHTAAYFAGYLAALNLRFIKEEFDMPHDISLYGGGWHHPIVRQTFEEALNGSAFLLPEHQDIFQTIRKRFKRPPHIYLSPFQAGMESLLWAAMGVFFDMQRAWTTPHLTGCQSATICGREALSDPRRRTYQDRINRAAKGWQKTHLP